MSPASKSKSKDKKSTKESQKVSIKPSAPASSGTGIPTSAYNPTLGTFHTLELSSSTTPSGSSSSVQTNGRFRNIDDSDDHHQPNAAAAGVEYDSVSNNGSWSGESEDPKEKSTNPGSRQDTIPGAENNDKREKIRQRNEKKHQRQKEKRNQELHERCTGYLMSRKLEALAQQLVSMGFSRERSTMALILNEGRVEESVAWLFEGGEEADRLRDQNLAAGSSLKIDISDELARVADLEIRYKCLKLEVERAIVSSEGDIEKAAELLRASRLDPPKPDDTQIQRIQSRSSNPIPPPQPPVVLQRRDERDFNYTKQPVTTPSNSSESVSKILQQQQPPPPQPQPQPPKRVQPKQPTQQVAADKRWPNAAAAPLQVSSSPAAKLEARYATEAKNIPAGSVREPVIMMQRPQSVKQQIPASMSSSTTTTATLTGSAASWYPTSTGFMPHIPNPSTARSLSPNKLSSNQMYHHNHHIHHQNHHQFHYQPPPPPQYFGGPGPMDPPGTSRVNANGMWSRAGPGPSPSPSQTTLAPASSLGLFSGLGSPGGAAAVDWSTGGSMLQLDYSSIDWTLDRGLPPARPNGLLYNNAFSSSSGVAAPAMMRSAPTMVTSNVNGHVSIDGGASSSSEASGGGGSREWTSPFEGEDLFSLPRQFVSSPSL